MVIGTNTLQTPNTKECYKVIHDTFYYIISQNIVLCIYIIIY